MTSSYSSSGIEPDSDAIPNDPCDLRTLKVGFIGSGRLATALGLALSDVGIAVVAVSSRRDTSAQSLAAMLPKCDAMAAQAVADRCNLVFVTTQDETIAGTASSLTWHPGVAVVHCSGATELSALAHAQAQGSPIGGFHPMQSFTDPIAAARSLPGCTISVEAEGRLEQTLAGVVTALGCRINYLPPGVRARYHAAAGYPSQFINVLLREAAKIWQTWGGTQDEALSAFLPMVRGTLLSIEARGLAGGMPGPVSRGDAKTVAAHVAALGTLAPEFLDLYTRLCARSLDLAVERSQNLDVDAQKRVRAALNLS